MSSKINCGCEFCKNNLPFTLPKEIIESVLKDEVVIFAGAGISTETKQIFKETLYEDVLADLHNPPKEDVDFPTLMSLYCKSQINGRQKLLQKIKFRFDYCQQFSELYVQASRFHQELSSIFYLKSIVTTNWDDYFEKETNAIPMVIPEDFAFHNMTDRKVYKIHGSISNYGSIIATKEDYDRCYKELNKGILGSYLKTILATKTVVFVGYSFRDYDFLRIYSYLKKELKEILPHCYIITIDPTTSDRLKNENITVIQTDGTYFLSSIREHLEGSKYLIPKKNIENVYSLKHILSKIHIHTSNQVLKNKQSNLVYCAVYQDGIKHALDYLIFHSQSGLSYYPRKIFNSLDTYEKILRKEKVKAKSYADVAYIDGYLEGLSSIFYSEDLSDFPFWYLYGKGPVSDKAFFDKAISQKKIFHKQAETHGKKLFEKVLEKGSQLVYHHRPFL